MGGEDVGMERGNEDNGSNGGIKQEERLMIVNNNKNKWRSFILLPRRTRPSCFQPHS